MAAGTMIRIGLVVQRYGREVVGGAETLARQAAEKLAARGFDITVFTTTALDYVTWENHYPEGESILRGVVIRRFPVKSPRNIDEFNRLSETFFAAPPGEKDEEEWIRKQGPDSPALLEALERGQDRFDLFVFVTYLYSPTVSGLPRIKKPVILFPTAHDELPLYLECMKPLFSRAGALFFLTQAEADLVERVFAPACPRRVVGTGIDVDEEADERLFRSRYGLIAPYILYAGRIEKGKGLENIFRYFEAIRSRDYVDLVLIGRKLMDIPPIEGVHYLGFVPEEMKTSAFKGAVLSVQPSPVESLSITTLESFSQRTPVLVNAGCPALMEHVSRSGGGLEFHDEHSFLSGFHRIFKGPRFRERLGEAGYEYVSRCYSWETVLKTVEEGIRILLGGAGGNQ